MISRTIYIAVCLALMVCAVSSRNKGNTNPRVKNANGPSVPTMPTATRFPDATVELTFHLLKELSKTQGNVVFSPTSIGILLSMLQQGAKGQTSNELTNILHATPQESVKGYRSFMEPATQGSPDDQDVVHQMASKMYVHPDFFVNETYQKKIQKNYQTSIENLQGTPVQAAAEINQWVKEATRGHITDIISPESLGANAALVMASAMFFNGKWLKKFAEVRTEKFRLSATEYTPVPFLVTLESLTAGRENDYKWVEIPYKGGNYSMYLVRSTVTYKHNLQGLLESMNGATLSSIFKAKSKKNVSLRMPKFKIQHKPAIKATLYNMGLQTIFTAQADLSGIAQNLAVSDIAHEAYVDVNEEGTEAAAATVAAIHTLSANWNPDDMDFRLDEPFLAFVFDKKRGVPILAAKIADPRV